MAFLGAWENISQQVGGRGREGKGGEGGGGEERGEEGERGRSEGGGARGEERGEERGQRRKVTCFFVGCFVEAGLPFDLSKSAKAPDSISPTVYNN